MRSTEVIDTTQTGEGKTWIGMAAKPISALDIAFLLLYLLTALVGCALIVTTAAAVSLTYLTLAPAGCALVFLLTATRPAFGLPVLLFLATTTGWLTTSMPGEDVYFTIAFALACAAGFIVHCLIKKESPELSRAHKYLLLFSFLGLASGIVTYFKILSFSPFPPVGYMELAVDVLGTSSERLLLNALHSSLNYFAWFGLFVLGSGLKSSPSVRRNLRWSILAFTAANAVAIAIQYYLVPGFFAPNGVLIDGRANGLMNHCNALGNTSALIIVFAPVWWDKGKGSVGVSLAALLSALFGLYFSGSRSGLILVLLAAAGMAVYAVARCKRSRASFLKRAVVAAFSVFLLIAAMMASEYFLLGRTPLLVERAALIMESLNPDYFYFIRGGMWGFATHMFLLNPLGGIGSGTYFSALANFSSLMGTRSWFIDNALNFYLHIAAELGFFALLLIIMAFAHLIASAMRAKSGAESPRTKLSLIAFIAFLVVLIFGPHLNDPETMILFWPLMGLWYGEMPREERPAPRRRRVASALLGLAVFAISVGAMVWGALEYHPARLWSRLNWHLEGGVYLPEADNRVRWTKPEALISVRPRERIMRLRWRVGDPALKDAEFHVRIFFDGRLLDERNERSFKWRNSYYWVGVKDDRYHVIGIMVRPAFVPDSLLGNEDRRELGLRLGSIGFMRTLPAAFVEFYPPEQGEKGIFRWSGEESYLRVKGQAAGIALRLKAPHKDVNERPVTVTFRYNGRLLEPVILKDNEWRTLRLDLSPLPSEHPGVLAIRVSRTWNPSKSEEGSLDNRELGVGLQLLSQN